MNASVNRANGIEEFLNGSLAMKLTDMIIDSQTTDQTVEEKPYHRGYYTGAFDMFHYGHLLALQRAASYCDQLIVAVSTDEVIRDYKHRDPIIPFEQRLAIVSAIKGVTLAIPQYDLYDKMGPVTQLGCDAIFTSTEYLRSEYEDEQMTDKQRAGVERWEQFSEEARENGVDVVYLPRTEAISSSEIKDRVVEQHELKTSTMSLEPTEQDNTEFRFENDGHSFGEE